RSLYGTRLHKWWYVWIPVRVTMIFFIYKNDKNVRTGSGSLPRLCQVNLKTHVAASCAWRYVGTTTVSTSLYAALYARIDPHSTNSVPTVIDESEWPLRQGRFPGNFRTRVTFRRLLMERGLGDGPGGCRRSGGSWPRPWRESHRGPGRVAAAGSSGCRAGRPPTASRATGFGTR